ncbi:MAG: HAMP domain-containing histidine kinase [Kineosporiaceae bacterium]|nr:HAMP domain-containing histidine kinase [Kineosporiaceae bacterium]
MSSDMIADPTGSTDLDASAVAEPDRTTRARRWREAAGVRWEAASLRARLIGLLVVLLLGALTATGYGVQRVLSGYLVRQIDSELIATADNARDDDRFLRGLLSSDGRRFPSAFVVQLSVDGHDPLPPASGFDQGPDRRLPSFPVVTGQRAEQLAGTAYTVHASDGSRWRATTFPVRVEDLDAPGAVTILESLHQVDKAVALLRLLTIGIGAAVLSACGLLGWFAIRRAFKPLREVEVTAAAIAEGDLSRRIPERPASTEVGRLTSSLNGMLAQIEGAFRAREASEARTRRFAADASHELRTPLASVRGYAELFRQGAVPPHEVPRTMRRIEDEATRMGRLVEDLLLLARLDEQRPGHSAPVDLAVLAGDAVHDVRALDAERRVRLIGLAGTGTSGTDGGPQPAPVTGDEDRLRQVVANLLANAVRHTPPGSPIEVAVGTIGSDAGAQAVLEVRDHGTGLTPEQAERVFERFYRADPSRRRSASSGAAGGSGLGLSIVDAVVGAHGGAVTVRDTPGGGATFSVSLPATSLPD